MDQSELRLSGEFSDLTVQIGGQQLHLHRFPLVACSDYFRGLERSGMSDTALVTLDHLPGGYDTMNLIADFCYGLPIEDKLTTKNIGHVTCAAFYLQMSGSDNLSEICQSKLKKLTSDVSNCLDILVNCVEIAEVAQSEGVSTFCVKAAVEHWCIGIQAKKWNELTNRQSETASLRLSQLKKLPVNWTAAVIDLMQTSNCCSAWSTYFVAGYIDFIMQCFTNVRKTASPYATLSNVDGTREPIVMAEPPNPIEIPSFSCSSKVSDHSTAAATCFSEKDEALVDSEKQKAEASALSSSETTLYARFSRCHFLPDTEESLLKNYFEAFLSYLPDDALTLEIPTVTASWLSSALQFSSVFVSQSEQRLTALCAKSYRQLTGKDVIEFTSRVMANLNNCVHTNGYKDFSMLKVTELSDYYLNYHAERGTISAAQFIETLQSTLWSSRSSFDSPFEALEKLLQSDESQGGLILQTTVTEIIELIDFTKLSQDALERASTNSRIPSRATMEAALRVCSRLRNELHRSQANFESYRQETARLQRLLHDTEAKVNELELFRRLNGTWTSRTLFDAPARFHHQQKTDFSLHIAQPHKQEDTNMISFTITATSKLKHDLSRGRPRRQSSYTRVRPAYILPLRNDKGDADVSSQHVWDNWYQTTAEPWDRIQMPTFLVYDLRDDCIFVPPLQSSGFGERRLVRLTKFP
ncbi:uncharacterized protein LOC134178675 [Corticium candelabrum]|uniref:uncharacterized protein LOC134178675 n=1 Tax=Corticium candelabrum TaxID=121492 RepID=UPI002E277266|nr:uncharacterized protein LOC134178675 [Corticium candelabrum]